MTGAKKTLTSPLFPSSYHPWGVKLFQNLSRPWLICEGFHISFVLSKVCVLLEWISTLRAETNLCRSQRWSFCGFTFLFEILYFVTNFCYINSCKIKHFKRNMRKSKLCCSLLLLSTHLEFLENYHNQPEVWKPKRSHFVFVHLNILSREISMKQMAMTWDSECNSIYNRLQKRKSVFFCVYAGRCDISKLISKILILLWRLDL